MKIDLTAMNFSGNPESDILARLSKCADIERLRISGWFIKGEIAVALGKLERLTALELIDVYWDLTNYMTGLGELSRLKHLELSSDCLADLSVLKPLTKLETLKFTLAHMPFSDQLISRIDDVSPLKHLPALRSLHIYINSNSMSGFAELMQLRRLHLIILGGEYDLATLGGLSQLEELILRQDVQSKPIQNLEPLAGLINLVKLDIRNNGLKSLEGIENMTRLQELDCSENSIHTLMPLEKLTELKKLSASISS